MYTKKTLEESIRRFTSILEADTMVRGIVGEKAGLTENERIMVDGAIDTIKSHVEALEVIDDLRVELRAAYEAINYWANR